MSIQNQSTSFHYKNLYITLDPNVYNPAEDTFLLLDSLKFSSKDSILEIGTGCGIIALNCAKTGANVIATDINPLALKLTSQNIKQNYDLLKGTIHLLRGNLFDMLKLNHFFDLIIFNPPYLPTTPLEQLKGWINAAYDGGPTGISVINNFLNHLPNYLTTQGSCMIVVSSLQNQQQLLHTMEHNLLTYHVIKQQHLGDEYIQIIKINKKEAPGTNFMYHN